MSTPAAPASILVPVVANATTAPLVLADSAFLAALSNAEQRVGALTITDAASYSAAGSLLNDLTITGTQLEESRVALKAPFLEIERQIDACAKAPKARIAVLKNKVGSALIGYTTKQREIAAQAERDRLAEIARLEAEQKRQADALAEKARLAALAAGPSSSDLDFDEAPAAPAPAKNSLGAKIEALKYAPAVVVAPAPEGVRFNTVLVFKIEDPDKLPDAYVTRVPNETLIRQTFCVGYKTGAPLPELPGVSFQIVRTAASTGKGSTGTDLF